MGNRYTFKTFEQWCIENDRQDILDLWDYELNDKLPSEVPAGTKVKYFFKCPEGIHPSESKRLQTITDKPNHQLYCMTCKSDPSNAYRDDLTGKVFGDLTVIGFDAGKSLGSKMTYWICKCSCGNIISALAGKLKSGLKTKCGGTTRHIVPKYRVENENFDPYDPKYLKELRKSPEYRKYRKDVLEKDGYKCVICGSSVSPEIHHIYPFASYPSYRLDARYGITLCKEHHSTGEPDSFHAVFGKYDNTPEQLEDYVNMKRKELGIPEYFDVYEYMSSFDDDNQELEDSLFD